MGPITAATLGRYRFDAAVIGAAGLSARWGITELTDDEAEIQRAAIDRAARLIVIADGSKVGASTPIVVAPSDRISVLVTDPSAPAGELDLLRSRGIQIHVSEGAPPVAVDTAAAVPAPAARRAS